MEEACELACGGLEAELVRAADGVADVTPAVFGLAELVRAADGDAGVTPVILGLLATVGLGAAG